MSKEKKYYQAVTPVGRLNWIALNRPNNSGPNPDDKYKITLMFDKATFREEAKELIRVVQECSKESPLKKELKDLTAEQNPFKDGDKIDQTKSYAETFKGKYYITAKTPAVQKTIALGRKDPKPVVVGPDKTVWTAEQIESIKNGDYARAVVDIFYYEFAGKKGLSLAIRSIQFARPGESLGGGEASSVNLFGELEVPLEDIQADNSFDVF